MNLKKPEPRIIQLEQLEDRRLLATNLSFESGSLAGWEFESKGEFAYAAVRSASHAVNGWTVGPTHGSNLVSFGSRQTSQVPRHAPEQWTRISNGIPKSELRVGDKILIDMAYAVGQNSRGDDVFKVGIHADVTSNPALQEVMRISSRNGAPNGFATFEFTVSQQVYNAVQSRLLVVGFAEKVRTDLAYRIMMAMDNARIVKAQPPTPTPSPHVELEVQVAGNMVPAVSPIHVPSGDVVRFTARNIGDAILTVGDLTTTGDVRVSANGLGSGRAGPTGTVWFEVKLTELPFGTKSGTVSFATNAQVPEFTFSMEGESIPQEVVITPGSSKPESPTKIYLDFDGHQAQLGRYGPVSVSKFNRDDYPTIISDWEEREIQRIWLMVSEIFRPFNLDVTTIQPESGESVMHVAVGSANGPRLGHGLSLHGSFTNSLPNVVFAFVDGLETRSVAYAISHQLGIAFGLYAQGELNLQSVYDTGDAESSDLMGNGLLAKSARWSNGPVRSSDGRRILFFQDDIAVISGSLNGFGTRPDDHGDSLATATPIAPTPACQAFVDPNCTPTSFFSKTFARGVIEDLADVDAFRFDWPGGDFEVFVAEYWMLRPNVNLKDRAGIAVQLELTEEAAPESRFPLKVQRRYSVIGLSPGTYVLEVSSDGTSGSVGSYVLNNSPDTGPLGFGHSSCSTSPLTCDAVPSYSSPPIPGDINFDRVADVSDIDLLFSQIEQADEQEPLSTSNDLNRDNLLDKFDIDFLLDAVLGIPYGDADLSGVVDFSDFLRLARNFGEEGGWKKGDFNGDYLVNFADFLIMARNFGKRV